MLHCVPGFPSITASVTAYRSLTSKPVHLSHEKACGENIYEAVKSLRHRDWKNRVVEKPHKSERPCPQTRSRSEMGPSQIAGICRDYEAQQLIVAIRHIQNGDECGGDYQPRKPVRRRSIGVHTTPHCCPGAWCATARLKLEVDARRLSTTQVQPEGTATWELRSAERDYPDAFIATSDRASAVTVKPMARTTVRTEGMRCSYNRRA
jgi:hypothetical protein